MKKKIVYALVISDVHLGSRYCNARKLLKVLKMYKFEWLIIVGDLHEDGKPIRRDQRRLVKYLQKIRGQIVLISGNHDPLGPLGQNSVAEMIGVDVVEKHEWEMDGKKFCALHGHQFDDLYDNPNKTVMHRMLCRIVAILELIESFGLKVASVLSYFYATFVVDGRVKAFALKHGYDVVIVGHTHFASESIFDAGDGRKRFHYNCGCWLGKIGTFLAINKKGRAKLRSV